MVVNKVKDRVFSDLFYLRTVVATPRRQLDSDVEISLISVSDDGDLLVLELTSPTILVPDTVKSPSLLPYLPCPPHLPYHLTQTRRGTVGNTILGKCLLGSLVVRGKYVEKKGGIRLLRRGKRYRGWTLAHHLSSLLRRPSLHRQID